MSATLRIAFIGCGRHATANLYPAAQLAGAQIVAVCAHHRERAQAAAEAWRAEHAYDSVAELLAQEEPDAVFVALPEAGQAAAVAEVLRAGRHVFVEKPLGLSERDAADLAALAERAGVYVMVGFMKRFAPAYATMRRLAKDPAFGAPLSLHGMFAIGSRSGWEDSWFLRTGGIHYVDLCRFLFGEVAEVQGVRNSHGAQVTQHFTLRFANGRIGGLFFAGVPAWSRHYEELTITAANGFVRVENMVRVVSHLDRPGSSGPPRWQGLDQEDRLLTSVHTSASGGHKDLYLNGYVGEISYFLDCLRTKTPPHPSAADNVKTMALADRMLRAIGALA